jgi:hypothetical protein
MKRKEMKKRKDKEPKENRRKKERKGGAGLSYRGLLVP